jgi:hypothetical protein
LIEDDGEEKALKLKDKLKVNGYAMLENIEKKTTAFNQGTMRLGDHRSLPLDVQRSGRRFGGT